MNRTTKQLALLMIEDMQAREVFATVFYKEPWETEIGIDDAKAPGVYITRDVGDDDDEEWEVSPAGRGKEGAYLVTAAYKAVAWFYDFDSEKVVNTLIVDIQKHLGEVTGVSYNARQVYFEETDGQGLLDNLGIVRVSFDIATPVTARNCLNNSLCKDDPC